MSKQVGDFFKFSGFLRKPQLYLKLRFVSNTFWIKIPQNSHSDMFYTDLITYLQTSGFFQSLLAMRKFILSHLQTFYHVPAKEMCHGIEGHMK